MEGIPADIRMEPHRRIAIHVILGQGRPILAARALIRVMTLVLPLAGPKTSRSITSWIAYT